VSITEDIEEFIRLHRAHGQLVGDATEPTLTGYRVTITCPFGVTFVRHVTAEEAVMDLGALARLSPGDPVLAGSLKPRPGARNAMSP
jgi:hypothetical protein